MTRTFAQFALVSAHVGGGPHPLRVNVLPLVGLFLLLIPFLLLCASFAPLAAVQVRFQSADPAARAGGVRVLVFIRPTLFRIEALATTGRRESRTMTLVAARALPDAASTRNPLGQLGDALTRAKERYPGADTVAVIPDETVPYEEVLATIDALRAGVQPTEGSPRHAVSFAHVVLLGSSALGTP